MLELVAGILYGAVTTSPDYSDTSINAMRQLHWTIHDVESSFTTWHEPTNERWLEEGYPAR